MESKLIERVTKAQTVLVLELKNLLSKRNKAIRQVKRAGDYLTSTSGCTPRKGLVYAHRKKRFETAEGLDVILYIPAYDPETALSALEKVNEESSKGKVKIQSKNLIEHIKDGADLGDLLYPRPCDWELFRMLYPHIMPHADTCAKYMNSLSTLKGRLVPCYVETAVKKQEPEIEIYNTHIYHDGVKSGDIDLTLLGDARTIFGALLNPKYFTPVKETEQVREESGRLKLVA